MAAARLDCQRRGNRRRSCASSRAGGHERQYPEGDDLEEPDSHGLYIGRNTRTVEPRMIFA
jgi:hypothetical protein